MANHIALRDSDAPFIEQIRTRRYLIAGQRDEGEWLFFITERATGFLREGPQGISSLADALTFALDDERRYPHMARDGETVVRKREEP